MSQSWQPPVLNNQSATVNWPRFVELVLNHQRFMLTTHVRPDCDALGSVLGMAGLLEQLEKEVLIAVGYEVPPNLEFIDPLGKIKRLDSGISRQDLESIDLLMILDTSAWAQLGHVEDVIRDSKAKKIVLDHHVSEDHLGAEVFKDIRAEATGRLVVEAADHLGLAITPDLADPLFMAVATDTGWFRFASTSAETYRLAARLVEAGAVPDEIYAKLYEKETLGRMKLTGRVLARAQTELDGRLIHTWIERADFEATGALPSDTEDMINMTLAVDGTQAAVILVEQPDGEFKVSFRSRCHVDCSRVAEQFGGGGHKKAAGALISEPFEATQAKVLDAMRAAMQ